MLSNCLTNNLNTANGPTNMTSFLFLLIVTFIFGVLYGFMAQRRKMFPYKYLDMIFQQLRKSGAKYGPWSIGILQGDTPFKLVESKEITNPVLSAQDVTDIDAVFLADPFFVHHKNMFFMFFETLNRKTQRGDIGYATSQNGIKWDYQKIVITEPFHLSYPYVFEWNSEYYLIPESYQDLSVRLYKAVSFPEKWEYLGNLLTGYRFVDPSIFRAKDMWWLFVTTEENDILNLYYSRDLSSGWTPHPMNPIIKGNSHIARPGGRIITHEGRLYRFAQDDYPSYGVQVFAFEITELSETKYAEKIVSERPLVCGTGTGWNAAGMHHVDLHELGSKWIAAVDGRRI